MNRSLSALPLVAGLSIGLSIGLFPPSSDRDEVLKAPISGVQPVSAFGGLQDPQDPQAPQQRISMEEAQRICSPGPQHEILKRFIGDWDIELRMPNGQGAVVGTGTASSKLILGDRFAEGRATMSMGGQAFDSIFVMGYDNMKQSFVLTMTNSAETAIRTAEGDLSRDKKSLVAYGLLDEYLTGEHDKMVKYAWRFIDDDTIDFEVHDLHIGEENAMVLHQTFKRKK